MATSTYLQMAVVLVFTSAAAQHQSQYDLLPNCKNDPPSQCDDYFDPVCGTDDRDYRNICELRNESFRRQRKGLSGITLAYGGPCWCNCQYCPVCYKPVCGDDGRTYWNICWLLCYDWCNQRRRQPRISAVRRGYC